MISRKPTSPAHLHSSCWLVISQDGSDQHCCRLELAQCGHRPEGGLEGGLNTSRLEEEDQSGPTRQGGNQLGQMSFSDWPTTGYNCKVAWFSFYEEHSLEMFTPQDDCLIVSTHDKGDCHCQTITLHHRQTPLWADTWVSSPVQVQSPNTVFFYLYYQWQNVRYTYIVPNLVTYLPAWPVFNEWQCIIMM